LKNYELIEHTADIGIRVKGRDLKDLFCNAASAIFDIIAEKKPSRSGARKTIAIKQKADNLQELFVSWLNELLSLSAAKGIIFARFQIKKLSNRALEALAAGAGAENYRVNTEVKAATYHQLKIEKENSGWLAEVIFDV